MDRFLTFVEFLVAIGVVIAAITNYLIINKLWKRKHLRDVSESVSVSAALLGLFTAFPLLIQFTMIDKTPLPAIKTAIGIATGFVFVFIGSGIWVKEYRGQGFFRLIKRSLNLERRESADLIKAMVQPKGARRILTILERLAAIDHHVHEREIQLIREFADHWKIDAPEMTAGAVDGNGSLLDVREGVQDYLDLSPPHEQAAQLMDVLNLFVEADEEVTREEELVLEEISGMISQYVSEDTLERPMYEVVIVPQSEAQVEAVRELIPGTEMKTERGGKVFSVGHFYSESYAEVVGEKYVALGLFTTHVVT
jgi:hypothetical protein